MRTVKALRIHAHGGPDVLRWEEAPDPACGPGEALVRVAASSVNRLDIFVRRGMPGVAVPFPRILGSDAAGTVAAVGPLVRAVAVGDRVVANPGHSCGQCALCAEGNASQCLAWRLLGESRDGAQAEYVAVPAESLVRIPEGVSFEEAAAAALVGVTAWSMLVGKARLRPGETVLIHGVGAGVGTAALQIAKLCGARVIVTSASDEKLARARALGADETVNYARQDVGREVRRLTDKRGADVVVDYIGQATWPTSLRAARRAGRIVTCGATSGFSPEEDLRHIFFRQLTIHGSTMGSQKEFREVMECLFARRWRAVIDRVLPADRAAEAHRVLEAGEAFGKIVLTVPG